MARCRDRDRVAVRRHAAGFLLEESGDIKIGGDVPGQLFGSAFATSKRRRFSAISSTQSSGSAGILPPPAKSSTPWPFSSSLLRLSKCFAVSFSSPVSDL
jgi:hypothetical protein